MLRLGRPLPRRNSPLKLKFPAPSLYPDLLFALMGSAAVRSSFSLHVWKKLIQETFFGRFCKHWQQTNSPTWTPPSEFTKNSCFMGADSLTLQTYSTFNTSAATIVPVFITYLLMNDRVDFIGRLQPASPFFSSDYLCTSGLKYQSLTKDEVNHQLLKPE